MMLPVVNSTKFIDIKEIPRSDSDTEFEVKGKLADICKHECINIFHWQLLSII